jgi:hypothetical protein
MEFRGFTRREPPTPAQQEALDKLGLQNDVAIQLHIANTLNSAHFVSRRLHSLPPLLHVLADGPDRYGGFMGTKITNLNDPDGVYGERYLWAFPAEIDPEDLSPDLKLTLVSSDRVEKILDEHHLFGVIFLYWDGDGTKSYHRWFDASAQ